MSWRESLDETYYQSGKFRHESPKNIKLFPYTTSEVKAKKIEEMRSFYAVSGEALRELVGVESDVTCSSSSVIANIKDDKVETQRFADLHHIIKKTLFDENDQISCFHPIIFYHLSTNHKDSNVKSFANFACDVLFEDNIDLAPKTSVKEGGGNVFHSLILSNLPPLNSKKVKDRTKFFKVNDPLCDTFVRDCSFLKKHPKLYSKNLPELIKFYVFIYQLQLVENLNSFFNPNNPQPFFFTVDWERLSKGRQSYLAGWRRVEKKIQTIFSHVQCLEMLNYIPVEGLESPFIYSDISKWLQTASVHEKQQMLGKAQSLIEFYKKGIESLNFDWDRHDLLHNNSSNKDIEGMIKYFFKLVQCQFKFSTRKAASNRYSMWLSKFAVTNYLKPSGPLGYTLCFSRRQLLFLTRLCIGDSPTGKLRLTELWEEFAQRGVIFDFESKKQVVNLFNKLNLIEKKSDSGDAQYVRAIF